MKAIQIFWISVIVLLFTLPQITAAESKRHYSTPRNTGNSPRGRQPFRTPYPQYPQYLPYQQYPYYPPQYQNHNRRGHPNYGNRYRNYQNQQQNQPQKGYFGLHSFDYLNKNSPYFPYYGDSIYERKNHGNR